MARTYITASGSEYRFENGRLTRRAENPYGVNEFSEPITKARVRFLPGYRVEVGNCLFIQVDGYGTLRSTPVKEIREA